MIKAVLFDYCGVLTEGGKVGAIRRTISKLTGHNFSEIEVGDLHDRLVCDEIGEDEYFAEIDRRYPSKNPTTRERFIANSDIYTHSELVYTLAAKLRASGVQTAIISNMYGFAADKLRAEAAYADFAPVLLSNELHVAKPDRAIFEIALQKLGVRANEVLYIDDQTRFRPVVEALGMHFIAAISPQQIVQDTNALLLKENHINLQ